MLSKAIFRSLRAPIPRLRVPPPSLSLPRQPSSIILRRFASNEPRGRFRPTHPTGKVIHMKWDPEQVQRAKPLIDSHRLAQRFKSRGFVVFAVFVVGGVVIFYLAHLEEVPVSGRKRFIYFSEETVEQEGDQVYRTIMSDARRDGTLLPGWDPRSRMVTRVMDRLIKAGELEHINWEIHVLNSNEANAFVIPGGKVFVFSGILPIAKTDDGLAAILGHEIAHNLARHSAESLSSAVILLMPLRWLFIALDLAGNTAGFGRMLGDVFLTLGIMRPASRVQETEADYIGLLMMAKACYDPNAAVGVWQRMEAAEKAHGSSIPQWLSTHPSSSNRIQKIIEWLPKADEIRSESGCSITTRYQTEFSAAVRDLWS